MYQEMLSSGMYDNYNEYMMLNTLARDEYEQELAKEEYEKECVQEELYDEKDF